MEWLLAHSDDTEMAPAQCVSADSTNSAEPNVCAEAGASSSSSSLGTIETTSEVKSFKCDDW